MKLQAVARSMGKTVTMRVAAAREAIQRRVQARRQARNA